MKLVLNKNVLKCELTCIVMFVYSHRDGRDGLFLPPIVTAVINEMVRLIEAKETTSVPENDNRTSDKPENDITWQGVAPHGAALPP